MLAGLTFACRIFGAVLMSRFEATPSVNRALDGMSVAVLAALVASALVQEGLRELSAVAITILVMLAAKNTLAAMLVGIAAAAAWANLSAM